jgi:hypothetical protein
MKGKGLGLLLGTISLAAILVVGCQRTPAVKQVITVGFSGGAILADEIGKKALTDAWEKVTGNKYTITVGAVMGDNFPNAMHQTFATGSGFDIFEDWGPAVAKLSGITIDMTDMVNKDWPDYKNGKLRKEIVDLWKTAGKFAMIPKEEGWKLALIYRTDWLKALGMQPPTNMDEFKAVAYAMAQKDPDGNGKKDTYGLAVESDSTWNMGNLIYAFGADNYFDIDAKTGLATVKGYLKNDAFLKELSMYRDMARDKVLNPNSFVTPNVTGEFQAGKTGMFFMDSAWIAADIDKSVGADNWAAMAFGPVAYNGGASLGLSTVAEKGGKEHLKAAWEVLKAFYSPEVQLTLAFGPENQGWSREGSTYKFIEITKYGGNITGNLRTDMNFYDMAGISKDPKQSYHAQNLRISGGHLNWLPNREIIERKMDEMMGKVVTGALTPEAAVTTLNTSVDEAFKQVDVQ